MIQRREPPFLEFLFTIVILYSTMPIIARIFSSYLTTYSYMLVLLLAFIATLISKRQSSLSEMLNILLPFIVYEVFIYVVGSWDILLWLYQVLLDLSPVAFGYFVIRKMKYGAAKYFSYVIFIALVVTSITTLIGLAVYPDASRYIATVSDSNEAKAVTYDLMNIGGYDFVYTCILVYPIAIYAFKKKRLHWAIMTAIVVLNFFLCLTSGYTIAFIFVVLSTIFLIFPKNLSVTQVIIILAISLFLIIVLSDYVSMGLNSLADVIKNKDISERLRALANGREGLQDIDDDRVGLYLTSLQSFIDSPILGGMINGTRMGGHSFIFDTMAQYGMFGIIFLIAMYRIIYKYLFRPYKNCEGFGFVFWTFLQILMFSAVNTGMWLPVLGFFAPVLFEFINKKGGDNEGFMDK